jgi:hypothetical protein
MRKIPEEEARALVSKARICEDIGDWLPLKVQPGTVVCHAGLIDESGASARMQVELLYRTTHKTRMVSYIFTLFKRFPYGNERIYQLEVTQTPKRIKDMHRLSHEHMGSLRTMGNASWSGWSYDEVLAHFCAATNISFEPKPSHPEEFKLTADR